MDDCSDMEEVVEGTDVYLHRGYITEKPLHFQPGDVLGMLLRLNRSSDFSPLLVRTHDATGFYYIKNGPYRENDTLYSSNSVTYNSPLISLELCESHSLSYTICMMQTIASAGVDSNESYPNCSDIKIPE